MYVTTREATWPLQQLVARMLEKYYEALVREDVKQLESVIATLMLVLPRGERDKIRSFLVKFEFRANGARDSYELERLKKQAYIRHLQSVIEALFDSNTIRRVLENVRTAEYVKYE